MKKYLLSTLTRGLLVLIILVQVTGLKSQTVNLGLPVTPKGEKKGLFIQIFPPKFLTGLGCIFLAGMADGTMQTLDHDYSDFKSVFPHANDDYCDPGKSWTRKYKDRTPEKGAAYIGSTGPLVCFTDLWHNTQLVRNVLIVGDLTLNLIPDKKIYLVDENGIVSKHKSQNYNRKWYVIASKAALNLLFFDGARQISFWIYRYKK